MSIWKVSSESFKHDVLVGCRHLELQVSRHSMCSGSQAATSMCIRCNEIIARVGARRKLQETYGVSSINAMSCVCVLSVCACVCLACKKEIGRL